MVTEVIMPAMGLTMEEGVIVRWLKEEGDRVQAGEPLLEIETDKSLMEVEAPASGVLLKILVREGTSVPVLQVIGYIGEPGEDVSVPSAQDLEQCSQRDGASEGASEAMCKSVTSRASGAAGTGETIRATPAARRIARELGIELSRVASACGKGDVGTVTDQDIIKFYQQRKEATEQLEGVPEGVELVHLKGAAKVMAERMLKSWSEIPQFVIEKDINASSVLELCQERQGIRIGTTALDAHISLTEVFIKATAVTLRNHPYLNARFTDRGIELWKPINIGVAVATENGLVVPQIKNADEKSLEQIALEMAQIRAKRETGKYGLDELWGSTFTISNLGMFGVDRVRAIINPPEVAILGIGRIVECAVTTGTGGNLRFDPHICLSLTCDHRVVDGARAARFLADLVGLLESMSRLRAL